MVWFQRRLNEPDQQDFAALVQDSMDQLKAVTGVCVCHRTSSKRTALSVVGDPGHDAQRSRATSGVGAA